MFHIYSHTTQLFASFTDSSGYISRDAFYQAFKEISEGSDTSESELRPVVDQLYKIFDTNHDGRCDFVEVSTGLTVLTAGSRDEKARSAFALFDYDGSGSISRDEMERYLTCVFRVVYEIEKQTKDAMGVPPEKLAKITTDQCFAEADLDEDDSLSFEEFKKWYSRPSGSSDKTAAKVVRQYVISLFLSLSLFQKKRGKIEPINRTHKSNPHEKLSKQILGKSCRGNFARVRQENHRSQKLFGRGRDGTFCRSNG